MHRPVAANHVMRAHLRTRQREGFERLLATVLGRVVNDDEIGFPHTKIGRPNPIRRRLQAYGVHNRVRAQEFGVLFCLFFVGGIRRAVRIFRGATAKGDD